MTLPRWIDLPPVWLAGFAALTWAGGKAGLPGGSPLIALAGAGLVLVGLALMAAAAFEMMRRRTTIIPHQEPAALVTTGIFALSRNPIYLGDAMILAGLALRWCWPALALVPVFMWVIERRFIRSEELRLLDKFPTDFVSYRQRTKRWL
ncbi:methyltransferase family protein [Litorisediminicola beolgyonensis]|uniref:Methyltransferase family protein n=1 Tax=Litorisediminicola beolgyonensis TaxID=1173614 RepID=A0ABW3ZHM9_9RHOB